jgi:hypothetical protein
LAQADGTTLTSNIIRIAFRIMPPCSSLMSKIEADKTSLPR